MIVIRFFGVVYGPNDRRCLHESIEIRSGAIVSIGVAMIS